MATETVRPKTGGNSPVASALTLAAWLAAWVGVLGIVVVLINGRFNSTDARFDDVTARLDRMEKRINERIDERFDRIEQLLRERTTP